MSFILVLSIAIRILAIAWSIVLWNRVRDWRIAFFTVMLFLMAGRQILTLRSGPGSETFWWGPTAKIELPGLLVSVMVLLAVIFLQQLLLEQQENQEALRLRAHAKINPVSRA